MSERPLILLSNDDGYAAAGIRTLRAALATFAEVVVCAPATEQSATSHAISLNRPLRLNEAEPGIFVVDGTPADCVYVALHSERRVVPRRPDLVVSGMNHGLNLGNDVFYSGTVAAAREGALRGVNALACSAASTADPAKASELAAKIARNMLGHRAAEPLLFNVNFPAGSSWEVKTTRLGNRIYQDGVVVRNDPRGWEYLWIGTGGVKHSGASDADTLVFDEGFVGITPLSLQLWASHHAEIAEAVTLRVRGE
jgi:5'-nucleotidase